ncbi:hypothetical protein RF11_06016 [Thelohanellus kitauei]|uniref:Reverse transcriptase RNase H-like domain-containing protein n=1 Tax=Thelohanellus kitauei TaxID=669202 RepID=A0A0C2N323_THEKT|nr:hypothetical protein RF11_06016 [Thelohanellus kitauei]
MAHTSKTLNEYRRRYSHLEREGLAIIHRLQKFQQFLYRRRFPIRCNMKFMAYDYTTRYRPGKQNANSDALSRLPCGHDSKFDQKFSQLLNAIQGLQHLQNRDDDIERLMKSCHSCRANARLQNIFYVSRQAPQKSFQRLHIDFLGPFMNSM